MAQQITLTGMAKDYASKTITFYLISDPVLRTRIDLCSTQIGSEGTFRVSFSLSEPTEIFTDLEKYCGSMVAEPGNNYEITLPPYTPRSAVEAASVYFKPEKYWLGLPKTQKSDINLRVREFVSDISRETVKNTLQIYQRGNKALVESIINGLESRYANDKSQFFRTLRYSYYADLEYCVNQKNAEVVNPIYLAKAPILLTHPTFQRTFNTLFTDQLRRDGQVSNSVIGKLIRNGAFKDLVALYNKRGYSQEISELIVIKGLNDAYYSASFDRKGILNTLDEAGKSSSQEKFRRLAIAVEKKLAGMQQGAMAHDFSLPSNKNEIISLSKYKGMYIYLNFISSASKDSKTELDSIVSIEKRLHPILRVVSVSVDPDFSKSTMLWKEKGYTWDLLNGSKQHDLLQQYNVFTTPSFILIAPNGSIQLGPAPAPSHEFEPIFLNICRNYRIPSQNHR